MFKRDSFKNKSITHISWNICFIKEISSKIINFKDTFNILLEVTFIDKIVGKIFNLDKKKIDPLSKNGLAKFMINNSLPKTNNLFLFS